MTTAPSSVRLGLQLGRSVSAPAPGRVLRALESVEVQQDGGAQAGFGQGFALAFRAERGSVMTNEFDIVAEPLLQPGCRVVISVTVNATPRVLMDGIVSQHHFEPASPDSSARFVVTGTDLTVLMDMVQVAVSYPALGHPQIAGLVLLKYAAFGVVPLVVPPASSWTESPLQSVPFQDQTDLQYLRSLASQHGYVFGIRPGPAPGRSMAYWGPRIRAGWPQKPLNVDMGSATNVRDVRFDNDALAPVQLYGTVHNRDGAMPWPVASIVATDALPLARRPAAVANQPFVRKLRLDYQGHRVVEALGRAQSQTNANSDRAVKASGTLDVLRYGDVLSAPGIVGLRGCGDSYDGHWFVSQVSHRIHLGEYTQSFQLTRDGLGSWTARL